MIPEKKLQEIRDFLKKSENPLFFFDDDTDGLCSYLLLKRYIDRGKGVVIKSSPVLDESFIRKVEEYNPDILFVLDKPMISDSFLNRIHIPLVWVDHHAPSDQKGVKYFNPRVYDAHAYFPTSYICYKVVKQDLWLAMCGIIGDYMIPEFFVDFVKEYPDLVDLTDNPGDVLFKQEFGKIIRVLSFILKGKTSEVNKCVGILTNVETPYEILNQTTPRARYLYKKFEKVNAEYQKLLKKAMNSATDDNILLFYYPSSKMSFTGELSNELSYNFPNKIIIIGRKRGDDFRLSLRSKTVNMLNIVEKALKGVEGYGGGHEYACGSSIKAKDLDKFIGNIRKQLS